MYGKRLPKLGRAFFYKKSCDFYYLCHELAQVTLAFVLKLKVKPKNMLLMTMNEKIKSVEDPFVTILEFRSKDESVCIDEAMLAVFPLAAWNEVSEKSTFKSDSLCNLLLTAYFDNADNVKSDMTHEFDVYDEHCVQLTIISEAKPVLREITLQDVLPTLQFALHSFEQDLFSNLM